MSNFAERDGSRASVALSQKIGGAAAESRRWRCWLIENEAVLPIRAKNARQAAENARRSRSA
jgi:hypothetical protein